MANEQDMGIVHRDIEAEDYIEEAKKAERERILWILEGLGWQRASDDVRIYLSTLKDS